jgi:hypothetical protein
MTQGRTNLREIAALSTVVRGIVIGIRAKGHPPVTAQLAGLDAVDAFVRGGKLTKAAADRLCRAIAVEAKGFGLGSPPPEKALYWVSGPVARLVRMAQRGEDDSAETLTYASYALGSLHELEWAEYDKRTKQAYAKAVEQHAHVSDAPLGEKPKRINKEKAAVEAELRARSRAALPEYARRLFDRIESVRDPKLVGTRDELVAVLQKHELPAHDAVLRFDEAFGGLLFQSEATPTWREKGMYAMVGAYACLASQGSRFPQKGLVPVVYDSHSGVEYLDANGKAYAIDEIEEVLTPVAADAATMLASMIAFDLLEGHGEPTKGFENRAGQVGDAVAKALGLTRVPLDYAGKLWVSDDVVVSEVGGTRIAAWSDQAWNRIQKALTAAKRGAAELFEEAAISKKEEDLAVAFAALVSEIEECRTLAQVEKLFLPYSLARAALQGELEQTNGEWSQPARYNDGQRVVSASLMRRLPAMSVDESAKALGWIAMHGGFRHAGLLAWVSEGHRRAVWCDSIEAEMLLLRTWTKDAAPSRRTSAAYALGFCAHAAGDEASALLAALQTESNANARGTELLALAAIARRSGKRAAETKTVLAAEKPKAGSFHAVAVIAARVFLDEPLSAAEVEVLVTQLRRSARVPPEWTWVSSDGPTKCDRIAADALHGMKLIDPASVAASLRRTLKDPKLGRATQDVKWALSRAAFAGSGKETLRARASPSRTSPTKR